MAADDRKGKPGNPGTDISKEQFKALEKERDALLESVKIHPFHMNIMKASLAVFTLDAVAWKLFSAKVMDADNWPILSTIVDMTTFALWLSVLFVVMTLPVRKKE